MFDIIAIIQTNNNYFMLQLNNNRESITRLMQTEEQSRKRLEGKFLAQLPCFEPVEASPLRVRPDKGQRRQ